MSNWTKGPLTVGEWDSIGTVVIGPRGVSAAWFGCGMSVGADGSYSISPAEAHANAKLYAAAPELVDALRSAIDALDRNTSPFPLSVEHTFAVLETGRAALAKAAHE